MKPSIFNRGTRKLPRLPSILFLKHHIYIKTSHLHALNVMFWKDDRCWRWLFGHFRRWNGGFQDNRCFLRLPFKRKYLTLETAVVWKNPSVFYWFSMSYKTFWRFVSRCVFYFKPSKNSINSMASDSSNGLEIWFFLQKALMVSLFFSMSSGLTRYISPRFKAIFL